MRIIYTYDFDKFFDKTIKDTAEDMAEYSKEIVPVKSGNLRKSIDTEIEEDIITLFADTDYATIVELGTLNTPPKPYLRPSLNRSFDFYIDNARENF